MFTYRNNDSQIDFHYIRHVDRFRFSMFWFLFCSNLTSADTFKQKNIVTFSKERVKKFLIGLI